jgi:toxin ParE1/3/4
MADYIIALQAEDDLQSIYHYGLTTYGEGSADAFYDALYTCFELIADSPLTWPNVDHIKPGYRRYVYRKGQSSTAIYYRVNADRVEIMAVVQRQDMKERS